VGGGGVIPRAEKVVRGEAEYGQGDERPLAPARERGAQALAQRAVEEEADRQQREDEGRDRSLFADKGGADDAGGGRHRPLPFSGDGVSDVAGQPGEQQELRSEQPYRRGQPQRALDEERADRIQREHHQHARPTAHEEREQPAEHQGGRRLGEES